MGSPYTGDPRLTAIILTVSTHDGNNLVFHYPLKPKHTGSSDMPLTNSQIEEGERRKDDDDSMGSRSDDSDLDEDFRDSPVSSDNEAAEKSRAFGASTQSHKSIGSVLRERESMMGDASPQSSLQSPEGAVESPGRRRSISGNGTTSRNRSQSRGSSGQRQRKGEGVDEILGMSTDILSETLSPPAAMCNSRFELEVDSTTFVSLPIHASENGDWKPPGHISGKHHHSHRRRRSHRHGKSQDGELDTDDDNTETSCPMYMFNLVFVMNPAVDEASHRIAEMYRYVIKPLTLFLCKWQHKDNFVWREAAAILRLREETGAQGRQWEYVVSQSILAQIISKTYEAISNAEIVNIEINGEHQSYQIPIKTEFEAIPPPQVTIPPGSTLTTVSPFKSQHTGTSLDMKDSNLAMNFALLLLDDPRSIILATKVRRDSPEAIFIQQVRPDRSLYQLSRLTGLPFATVHTLALHMVFWRRAKVVLPVSLDNVYMISPLAPLSRLYEDSEEFKSKFSTLQGLASFLVDFSQKQTNVPLGKMIPSRDHGQLYVRAMAWLLKKGYMTQEFMFAWIRIPKEVQIRVSEKREDMMKRKASDLAKQQHANRLRRMVEDPGLFGKTQEEAEAFVRAQAEALESAVTSSDENEGSVEPADDRSTVAGDDPELSSSDRTASLGSSSGNGPITDNTTRHNEDGRPCEIEIPVLDKDGRQVFRKGPLVFNGTTMEQSVVPMTRRTSSTAPIQYEEEMFEDLILMDPESADRDERDWVAECTSGKSPSMVTLFYRLAKYMNGQHPLELVMLKENVSRKDVYRMIRAFPEEILIARHW